MKYQIRFCDSKGHGYFIYVDAKSKKGIENKCAEAATKEIIEEAEKYKTKGGGFGLFLIPPKPKKTLNVWEWDLEKREPKKGGHRFKLRLAFIEYTYAGGGKRREEWYEPVIEDKK